ncbi:hypothetical protein H696_01423 [Fonticula alba]|uniref:leucine--tRNA ligase n=1 Tax=Fonticula alba TaxID=691883 RepID=A0A058ZDI8_FONAL|nr:hypothetical protein H696_01423 [Fonticula alba]KCV72016.1 hypothetical protein H696_01423 [Fonticula alba]|eukprot:XP_009493594.1 hypothetical protein H696_01423 [Fonticula alba]
MLRSSSGLLRLGLLRGAAPAARARAPLPWMSGAPARPLRPLAGALFSSDAYHYHPGPIETKWQAIWKKADAEVAAAGGSEPLFNSMAGKKYVLSMFPYPSGHLHMGHVRVYTISDVVARFARQQGLNVLHPIGFDAFGLPAENAAIERGIAPAEWTRRNTAHMREQLRTLGIQFDWDRELSTCDPGYYRWTQWLFAELFRKGLAYRQEAAVNWDPVDCTVLANEQVDAEGRSWRSGALVERRQLRQWFVRTTSFADDLLHDLESVDWPENVKQMQRNWITYGRYAVTLPAVDVAPGLVAALAAGTGTGAGRGTPSKTPPPAMEVSVASLLELDAAGFVVVGPGHPLAEAARALDPEGATGQAVSRLAEALAAGGPVDEDPATANMAGVLLPGVTVTSPLDKHRRLPVYVAAYADILGRRQDHALAGADGVADGEADLEKVHLPRAFLGTAGCSLAVAFAREHGLDLPADRPLRGSAAHARRQEVFRALDRDRRIRHPLRLRDWLISRQRFWGCPIPVVYCQDRCAGSGEEGAVPVPDAQLPVSFPESSSPEKLAGRSLGQLLEEWRHTTCPCCNGPALRETDTMDTFVDSSWYFMRYCDPHNDKQIFDPKQVNQWMPVDIYVGGVEHAILHLLYARFITKFLHSEGHIESTVEPFQKLLVQGLVNGATYKSPVTGAYLKPHEVDMTVDPPVDIASGQPAAMTFEKMSKSKYNGVDPEVAVSAFGADTVRVFILFKAPYEQVLEWDDKAVAGPARWLRRVWALASEHAEGVHAAGGPPAPPAASPADRSSALLQLRALTHSTVERITRTLSETYTFNLAISDLMKLTNALAEVAEEDRRSPEYHEGVVHLLQMLAPFAPHISSELWETIHPGESITEAGWPKVDQKAIRDAVELVDITLPVMINGKNRGRVVYTPGQLDGKALQQHVEALARAVPTINGHLADQTIDKVIFVPGRLLNFVLEKK